MKFRMTFLSLLIFLCLVTPGYSQVSSAATLDERLYSSTIYLIEDGQTHAIYADSDAVFFDYYIKLSPNGKFIAAISNSKGFIRDSDGRDYIARNLVVLTNQGRVQESIPDVQRFTWSPDGNQIAYIVGKQYEGYGFKSEALWVLDISAETRHKLTIAPTTSFSDAKWVGFDSCIYVKTGIAKKRQVISRVDPKSGKSTETTLHGINFSPDGKYYASDYGEGASCRVFRVSDNQDVTPSQIKLAPAVNFAEWLPDQHALVAGDILGKQYIIDVEDAKVMLEFTGRFLGFDTIKHEAILLKRQPTRVETARIE